MLDEAAAIYLRHQNYMKATASENEARLKAFRALEEGLARLMELGVPESVSAQKLCLEAGWAVPLLEEMRAVDKVLTRQIQLESEHAEDPLARLREIKMELIHSERALEELDQRP